MADTHDQSASAPVYYAGFDFGTIYSAVSWIKVHQERRKIDVDLGLLQHEKLKDVAFRGQNQVRTQIAWNERSKEVLHGYHVDEAIKNQDLDETDRLEYLKLGLDTSAWTERNRKKLAKTLSDLPHDCPVRSLEAAITSFLSYLFEACLRSIGDVDTKFSPSNPLHLRSIVCAYRSRGIT